MVVYTLDIADKDQFEVTKVEENKYLVTGHAADNLMRRINVEDNESMSYFLRMLVRLGIEQELILKGVEEGDTVEISGWEFEWID